MTDLVGNIFTSLNTEVLNQLELAKSVKHPGESGRAREQILETFFRKLLPQSFGISTGFVIDATGKISKQIDLVIYRNSYHPVFEIGGIKHFLVESVAAVMENKASIKSTNNLQQALENIKSVKLLDRSNRGKNYTINGSVRGISVEQDNFQHQIFSAILTEESLSRDVLRNDFLNFLRANPKNLWPNMYVDVKNMTGLYVKSIDPSPETTVIPSEAEYFALTNSSTGTFNQPLIHLASELSNFLRITPLIDYKALDYMKWEPGKIEFCKI